MASSMSAGLQHAAGASFFPTAKELSSGVQWFKDHPVLAAAAATAVSVITYLNATERGEDEAVLRGVVLSPPYEEEELEGADRREVVARPALKSAVRSPLADGGALERRLSGEGKLSAAVSWCDEHGGSLTQVFEEEEDDEEDEEVDEVDLDQPLRLLDALRRPARRRTSVSSTASSSGSSEGEGERAGALRKSTTAAQLLDAQAPPSPGAAPTDEPLQTESPQWGWYVPITPPQDQFVAAQPRAMAAVRPLSSADPRRGD